ncbi:MAG: LuxR C-terminal-related transcriptional regulator, partial [Thermocrispum sp.]
CVLVANDPDGLDVPSAVRYRVVAVLPAADLSADELLVAVRSAATGALPPEDLTLRLVEQLDRISRGLLQPGGGDGPQLAPRERDLLRLLADGCDTAEIAARLCYSERTVKNIVHGLLDRLQLRNRTHAVAYALRAGVL